MRGEAAEAAGRLPTGAHLVHSADCGKDLTALTVDLDGAEREEVVAALVTAGFGVRRVEPVRSDLEQVFLDLVRGDATTGSPVEEGGS